MTEQPSAHSPDESVAALQTHLNGVSRVTEPVEWAVGAYRLGLARTEHLGNAPTDTLRSALGLFEQAIEVLTAERAPIEHARILNAAGSARRMLGERDAAARLFTSAASLLAGRGAPTEHASVLSNLGLALHELGETEQAIEVFERSLQIVPTASDEDRRTRVATQHNLAQAQMALGTTASLDEAIATLDAAAQQVASLDAPMHLGMIWHSLGVAWKTKATLQPHDREGCTDRAIECFHHCLTIFTSTTFPFQFAIAKHNLGHAFANRGDLTSLRRALANYEDAMYIFDPRLHRPYWTEVTANLELLDERLAALAPYQSRADHVAALLGEIDEVERLVAIRHRFAQMERLPEQQRVARLTNFASAAVQQPPALFVATLKTTIMVLMELPETVLQSALVAQIAAHARLEPHDQRAADFMLDEAIDLLLFGPQRIRVRDLLQEIGWVRP